jgi:hypothetical protein
MGHDKDRSERNAHERTSAEPSTARPLPDERDAAAAKKEKDEKNPLSRLHFGSAGSGGAELEPGPERP